MVLARITSLVFEMKGWMLIDGQVYYENEY